MSLWLSGIGVSRGIAIGRVQRMHGGQVEVPEYTLAEGDVAAEVERFTAAQKLARDQLRLVRKQIPHGLPSEISAFIDTHLLMMEDRSMSDAVVALIRGKRCNAEAALRQQRDQLVAAFEQMEDPYLRTRRDDVEHVAGRILRILLKSDRGVAPKAGASPAEPQIVVSDDLTPADIILMSRQHVVAFITEYGGPLSHTAILARSLGMPAVVGVHNALRLLQEDEQLIVDGEPGHAIASPDGTALSFYSAKKQKQLAARAALGKLKDRPAVSRDGAKVTLLANIELPEDAKQAAKMGAEGVGLYRTEFLYMNREGLPGEEEQYEAYARVIASVKGPITIRTLDLGADKQVDSGRSGGPTPNNPALGLRAIRLCLRETELFRTQLRALLRASVHGAAKIMLPMISSLQEFRQALAVIDGVRAALKREGKKVADNVEVGVMIEVPSAAIAAPILARQARFFSIGTNDLIQYTLAIDRVDDEVNYLYDPLHPAVLQLIRMTIQAGAAAKIPVAMCGEMAGDPRFTRLLLGLGLTEFSMHPSSVLEVKGQIIESDVGLLRERVAQILEGTDGLKLRDELEALTHL
jgi:phosphotransferase system enzyme I (PtsI)